MGLNYPIQKSMICHLLFYRSKTSFKQMRTGSHVYRNSISYILKHYYILLIIPLLIISAYIAVFTNINSEEHEFEYEHIIGYYICGESFSSEIINNDISDTLGLSNENIKFYYTS